MSLTLPTITFEELFHVGTLNIEHKGEDSHEGAGLSVSLHPEEWTRIASLGGGSLFTLKNPKNEFLDFHHLTEQQLDGILKWGEEKGYVETRTLYRVQYFDDELDSNVFSDYISKADAEGEAEGYEVKVQEVQGHISTPLMQEKVKGQASPIMVADLLSTIYVEEETNMDGVWWNDILDVYSYSAPRGVIVPTRLATWSIEE